MGSMRGNHSSPEETTGLLSRPGLTAAAPIEKPALSLIPSFQGKQWSMHPAPDLSS